MPAGAGNAAYAAHTVRSATAPAVTSVVANDAALSGDRTATTGIATAEICGRSVAISGAPRRWALNERSMTSVNARISTVGLLVTVVVSASIAPVDSAINTMRRSAWRRVGGRSSLTILFAASSGARKVASHSNASTA